MKIDELLNDSEINSFDSTGKKILYLYKEKDCVIAYTKNKLGKIFIIKGKTKYFAFFCINNMLRWYMMCGICGRRIDLDEAIKLLGNCNLLDKEEYERIKRGVILDNL